MASSRASRRFNSLARFPVGFNGRAQQSPFVVAFGGWHGWGMRCRWWLLERVVEIEEDDEDEEEDEEEEED